MQTPESYVNERLDHLGVVAGVCEEIGLAGYLDRLAGETKHHVSMGTATVAMILNGLGFSNRRLYLVPQFFANKPVEHLLGPGIEAADLNDDCLDRTLDWLYAHDPTQLFAGIATQAQDLWGECASCACGYDVIFREWGLRGRRVRRERSEHDRHHLRLLPGSSRRSEAMDARARDDA